MRNSRLNYLKIHTHKKKGRIVVLYIIIIIIKWRPPGRRKRDRPNLTCAEGVRRLMGEKELMEEGWNDRNIWRKEII
jgi:hypothetical protein